MKPASPALPEIAAIRNTVRDIDIAIGKINVQMMKVGFAISGLTAQLSVLEQERLAPKTMEQAQKVADDLAREEEEEKNHGHAKT